MEDQDSADIDPEIAAAMGFAAFGSQASNKKRKFKHEHAVVAETPPNVSTTGSNTVQLGIRNARPANSAETVVEHERQQAGKDNGGRQSTKQSVSETTSKTPLKSSAADPSALSVESEARSPTSGPRTLSREELAALRRGVRNAQGDLVYFLPSFVEDPWGGI